MYERWTSSVKRRTNSARSAGVRCAQYCPRDRFAISPKSKISLAAMTMAVLRWLSFLSPPNSGSPRILNTRSIPARSCSPGEVAQASRAGESANRSIRIQETRAGCRTIGEPPSAQFRRWPARRTRGCGSLRPGHRAGYCGGGPADIPAGADGHHMDGRQPGTPQDPSLDHKTYLSKARGGTTKEYRKEQLVFSQGHPADAVCYVEKGRVKLTVLSARGKEAVV